MLLVVVVGICWRGKVHRGTLEHTGAPKANPYQLHGKTTGPKTTGHDQQCCLIPAPLHNPEKTSGLSLALLWINFKRHHPGGMGFQPLQKEAKPWNFCSASGICLKPWALLWNYPLQCVHTGKKSACKWNYSSASNPKNGKTLA